MMSAFDHKIMVTLKYKLSDFVNGLPVFYNKSSIKSTDHIYEYMNIIWIYFKVIYEYEYIWVIPLTGISMLYMLSAC